MLLAALYLLLLILSPILSGRLPPPPPQTHSIYKDISAPIAPPGNEPAPFRLHHVVQTGQTLAGIFQQLHLDTGVLVELLANERISGQLASLQPGDTLSVEPDTDGTVLRLLLDRHKVWQLRVDKRHGEYRMAEHYRRPREFDSCGEMQRSHRSVRADAQAAEVPEGIVRQMNSLLNLNEMAADAAGDQLLFLYRDLYIDGHKIGTGPLTALEYRSADGSRLRQVFRYRLPQDDKAAYYSANGDRIRPDNTNAAAQQGAPSIPPSERAVFTALNRTRIAHLHLCSRLLIAEQRQQPPSSTAASGRDLP